MSNPTPFVTVPNQKVVQVHRDMPKEGESGFLMVKKANLFRAYNDLGYPGVYLYLYMVGNKDKYTFGLSPSAINKAIGMPDSTCSDQIKKMIEKGYLVPQKEGSNYYHFYEFPFGKKDTNENEIA